MLIKYKVSEVAKDFAKSSKDILAILKNYNENGSYKVATVLDENELNYIFDRLTQSSEVKSFDDYFALGSAAQEKRKQDKEKAKADRLADQLALAQQLKAAAQAQKEGKSLDEIIAAADNANKAEKSAKNDTAAKAVKPEKEAKAPEKPAAKAENKPKAVSNESAKSAENAAKANEPKKANDSEKAVARQQKEKKKPAQKRQDTPIREKQLRERDNIQFNTVESYRIDTRSTNVDLDKYNERYDNIAPASKYGDQYQKKQKIHQKSQQYRKGNRSSKRETEQDRLRRMQLEKIKAKPIEITVGDEITVAELASRLKKTAAEVIKKLMTLGMMVSANEVIDYDTAEIVATELGAKVKREVVVTIEERIMDVT